MVLDAQEMRRRWSDRPKASFGRADLHEEHEFAATDYEREFHFRDCRNILFRHGEDVLLLTQGSGHMTLPAKVRVLVQSGYAKCEPAGSKAFSGFRAPPPSRVSGYARSSAGSACSGSIAATNSYHLNKPPRDAASFTRGTAGSAYMSARSQADPGDWEVIEEDSEQMIYRSHGFRGGAADDCSIAPSESISSVGSRGIFRRHTQPF
ncbi:hypothetical protein C7999DRAFT_42934 [Corynascus novoguineensis]|uniref:Uncharacterized protein n=1 Tax=Corynascus novoguineensis TaxID=1126955 RepID=A0AAN7HHC4_9PEZI|nr:hypothetical protein C7999DRAFT_42934 [Corynascus novoguineensis]